MTQLESDTEREHDRRAETTTRGRLRVVGYDTTDTELPADPVDATLTETGSRDSFWRKFRRNRLAVVGLLILLGMGLLTLFARPLEVTTAGYTFTLQPFSLAPYDPSQNGVGPPNAGPSLSHPFGTDWAGRDLFSRVLVGGRLSLGIGLLAVGLALTIGIPLGALAGYTGGWIDELIMRLVDTLYAFPMLVLAIAIVAVAGQGIWTLILALVVTGWIGYARLLRGEVRRLKDREYVLAAKALGATDRRIIRHHLLPNAIGPVIIHATLGVGTVVLAAAALGFLGLGLEPGSAEWGSMLARGRSSLVQGHWHITVFPGAALFVFVLSINLVGDGVRNALEGRTEGRIKSETLRLWRGSGK